MEITEECVFQRAWRVSHELPEENKVAFFDEAQSELVVVNAMGGAIWQLLDGKLSVKEICSILETEVEGVPDRQDIEDQVQQFLSSLLERKAIQVTNK